MRALLIQHGCEAALKVLPTDMEAEAKVELNKKAHSAVILWLGNTVLREVIEETIAVGVWTKLDTLYMKKSLTNKLNMDKKLYRFYMLVGRKIFKHINEFNEIVLDLANVEIKFKDEDLALLLLTSLPTSYGHFYGVLLGENKECKIKGIDKNGVAKRINRILMDKVTINNDWEKTPMEMRSRPIGDYGMLRVFGCVAYSHVKKGKLEPRAVEVEHHGLNYHMLEEDETYQEYGDDEDAGGSRND
nr:retrovirus-related Pol polyprotein from transposon TNT 1-94 [Tanacetum cinerariifolium]